MYMTILVTDAAMVLSAINEWISPRRLDRYLQPTQGEDCSYSNLATCRHVKIPNLIHPLMYMIRHLKK